MMFSSLSKILFGYTAYQRQQWCSG